MMLPSSIQGLQCIIKTPISPLLTGRCTIQYRLSMYTVKQWCTIVYNGV